MNTVKVSASGAYDILIGTGLLPMLAQRLRDLPKVRKITLVSDSHVSPLWARKVREILENAGYSLSTFVFPAGEDSKCPQTYLELLDHLARNHMTRTDCIAALGGGVVGDLSGFAAATYLRGIPFLQIPTSLLAAVDSSVGGKTAIDLPSGKNLVGAFYQPKLVVCDLDTLETLPRQIFIDGCAEVIKYAILYDEGLFRHLEDRGLHFDRQWVITRCVELKRDVVEQDEFDRGLRMKLNLGHTVGHGIEAASRYSVSHGQAVAMGTAIVARAAAERGLCTPETRDRILSLLKLFALPTATQYCPETLAQFALSDKKRAGDKVTLIVPREIGRCDLLPTPVEELTAFIKEGDPNGSDHPAP